MVFCSTFFGYFFCIFRPFRIYRVSYCVNVVVIFILVSFSGYGFGAWGPQTCLFRLSFFFLIPAFFLRFCFTIAASASGGVTAAAATGFAARTAAAIAVFILVVLLLLHSLSLVRAPLLRMLPLVLLLLIIL